MIDGIDGRCVFDEAGFDTPVHALRGPENMRYYVDF